MDTPRAINPPADAPEIDVDDVTDCLRWIGRIGRALMSPTGDTGLLDIEVSQPCRTIRLTVRTHDFLYVWAQSIGIQVVASVDMGDSISIRRAHTTDPQRWSIALTSVESSTGYLR